jgi:hypothetical protein
MKTKTLHSGCLALLSPTLLLALACGGRDPEVTSKTASAATTGESAPCTTVTQPGQSIIDAAGNTWTLGGTAPDLVVYENGALAGYSANVTELVYVNHVVSQENTAGGWWSWGNGTWNAESNPAATACAESASCTAITQPGESIVDGSGNVWSLGGSASDLVVYENGALAGYSADVTQLLYVNHVVSQENAAGGWWSWGGGTWNAESNPSGSCSGSSGTGSFSIAGGQIIGPNGQPFIGRGINVYDSQMSAVSTGSNGAPLTSVFPGINLVRLNVFSYQDPSYYQTFIRQMTALGIVVELEDHTNNAGNAGGGAGTVFSGSQLTSELDWYASVAGAFAGNPYVWFGTDNEPSENPSAAALSTWQGQTYDAIRNAGNTSLVLIEMNCGNTPSSCGQGYTSSVYAGMTNIVWDAHYYGWVVGYSTDVNVIAQSLSGNAQAAQQITSADGVVPVIFGEYGVSTDGQNTDPNGTQVVTVVDQSGFGSMAWGWDPGENDDLTDGSNNLTSYGQQVAQFIAN